MTTPETTEPSWSADDVAHPGWYLDYGFRPTEKTSKAVHDLFEGVVGIAVPHAYEMAYRRWCDRTGAAADFARGVAPVDGRLFVGKGEATLYESGITLRSTYGLPYLPGSTLKGLARAYALADDSAVLRELRLAVSGTDTGAGPVLSDSQVTQLIGVLFGVGPGRGAADPSSGAAGYLRFHDAWWRPGSARSPFCVEVVNIHHRAYYESEGKWPASPLDSPEPVAQLAVQGEFRFVVEGAQPWANLGLSLLSSALKEWGYGGRTHVDYGYFYPMTDEDELA